MTDTVNNNWSTTGVVLAGGRSSRFGSNKAFAKIGGATFIARVAAALSGVCTRTIVSGAPETYAAPTGLRCVADLEPGLGPLGGIMSAMEQDGGELFLFVPCDMPLVSDAELLPVVRALRAGADCAVGAVGPQRQRFPLGLRRSAALPAVRRLIASGRRRVADLTDSLDTVVVAFPPGSGPRLQNANTPDTLNTMLHTQQL